jgi:hypothetical protein
MLGKTPESPLVLLLQVLAKQPRILPAVLPRLASPPMTSFKARALASLADVVGAALHPHLDVLLSALLPAMADMDPDNHQAAREAATAVSQVGQAVVSMADMDPDNHQAAREAATAVSQVGQAGSQSVSGQSVTIHQSARSQKSAVSQVGRRDGGRAGVR